MPDKFNFSDVMISYSRKDTAFVRMLDAEFRKVGDEVWVDWEDIMPTEDWWQAIAAGIEAANTFVFVISPDSISSGICRRELGHALTHNKRIVPILYRPVTEEQIRDVMHPTLRRHNWINFQSPDNFKKAFKQLRDALHLDLNNVREHTRLLVRAREWDQKGRPNSLLLRGDDLYRSRTWLLNSADLEPEPTEVQIQYIETSHTVATNQRRILALTGTVILVVLSSALIFGLFQNITAQHANEQRAQALDLQQKAYSEAATANAAAAFANANATNAFAEVQNAETELASLNENADVQQSSINTQIADLATLNYQAANAESFASTKSAEVGVALQQAQSAFVAVTQAQANVANVRSQANQTLEAGQATIGAVEQTLKEIEPTMEAISISFPMTLEASYDLQTQIANQQNEIESQKTQIVEIEGTMRATSPCSNNSTKPIDVTFVNQGDNPVALYWIDYNCEQKFYGYLEGGASRIQGTYVSHPWVIQDCATGQKNRYEIRGERTINIEFEDIMMAQSAYCDLATPVPQVETFECSQNSGIPIDIRFTNASNNPVAIYWVSYDCEHRPYAYLESGESYTQGTAVTHPWIAVDCATGEEYRYNFYSEQDDNTEVLIEFPSELTIENLCITVDEPEPAPAQVQAQALPTIAPDDEEPSSETTEEAESTVQVDVSIESTVEAEPPAETTAVPEFNIQSVGDSELTSTAAPNTAVPDATSTVGSASATPIVPSPTAIPATQAPTSEPVAQPSATTGG